MTGESAAKAAAGARSKMSLQEAQMILDVQANAPWEDVVKARALSPERRRGDTGRAASSVWLRPNVCPLCAVAPQRYNTLMAANAANGSFYLQSKARAAPRALGRAGALTHAASQVHRSMERIGQEMGQDTSGMGGAGPADGSDGAAGGSTPPEGGADSAGGPGSVKASAAAAAAAHAADAPRWGGFAASGVGTDGRH